MKLWEEAASFFGTAFIYYILLVGKTVCIYLIKLILDK